MIWLVVVLWALLWGLVGYKIAAPKGRGDSGAVWGALLGPLGVLVAALLTATPEARARQAMAEERVRADIERAERARRARGE